LSKARKKVDKTTLKGIFCKISMKVIILSRSAESHFNNRIFEECTKRDVQTLIINPLDCPLGHNEIIYQGQPIDSVDLCFLRTPPYQEEKDYFHQAARIFQMNGCNVVNSPSAVEISGNKFRTHMFLEKAGLPILPSMAVRMVEHLAPAVEKAGGYPVFLKTFMGTRGIGVIFCPTGETLRAAAETMWAYRANVFVEKYAAKSKGNTVRVLVCGEHVLGAVNNRAAVAGENDSDLIRSNFSRGGEIEIFNLARIISQNLEEIALKACRTIGLEFAGVDLIEDDEGWKVLEVNSSPGIKGFEKALGENIAGKILDILLRKI
jgi:ribosomal protein S6--L-glutamate ligase